MRIQREKKDILMNMGIVAQDLMNLIKDGSDSGQERLIACIVEARSIYKQPTESLFQGHVYQRSRQRIPEIDNLINNIINGSGALNQVLQCKAMISNGEWNIGSFNTSLFITLLKKTDAWWMPSLAVMQAEIIPRLKVLLFGKIEAFIQTACEQNDNAQKPEKVALKPGRINLSDFSKIGDLFDTGKDKQKPVSEIKPGRLNLTGYDNIALLFDKNGSMKKVNEVKPGRINTAQYGNIANLFAQPIKATLSEAGRLENPEDDQGVPDFFVDRGA